ncbi:PulJ/GspJ family protein [Singulisphaera rosea]
MTLRFPRPRSPRRGVTLVEMLVAVALLVLMMTILVTIFSAATGAVSGLQTYQELDGNLRQLDSIIRQDLQGVTARLTPPLDPKDNLGYFEYGENQFADAQGEDSDDYVRFTAKAPEGQLFTGRCWINNLFPMGTIKVDKQPIVVTSQYAEIIYFLRNGNLYRRVLLVAPDRQSSIYTYATTAINTATTQTVYEPEMFAYANVSWQGMNDLSARPSSSGSVDASNTPIILNNLGDLTNRENRFAYPRFANDFMINSTGIAATNVHAPGDGIADDEETDGGGFYVGNGVHDFYPTLYPNMIASGNNSLLFEVRNATATARGGTTPTYDQMPFPYIFPGAYSMPDSASNSLSGAGWIHSEDPSTLNSFSNTTHYPAATGSHFLDQLLFVNHNPLELGDSLPLPQTAQTWWGFPTWRETMSPAWTDPGVPFAANFRQPDFLHPFNPSTNPGLGDNTATSPPQYHSLPPMTVPFRITNQPNNDGRGSNALSGAPSALWNVTWEDDLVMTGVRSFDVKAYDNAYAGYVDLGWGDDLRIYQPFTTSPYASPVIFTNYTIPPYLMGNADHVVGSTPVIFWPPIIGTPPYTTTLNTGQFAFDLLNQTFAHEGRIPPRIEDLRLDSQYGATSYPSYTGYTGGNIGDNGNSVIRLRRVWDSWSTAYSRAPSRGFDPVNKLPIGPPISPPVYPSYPAPYPAPLRALQIQVRVVDPRNSKVKVLTIRQDFSDKL